jgi:hypothetical protein
MLVRRERRRQISDSKFGEPSRGWKTHSVKAEPSRPKASLAASRVTGTSMRRHARVRAADKRPRKLRLSQVPRVLTCLKAAEPLPLDRVRQWHTWRGICPWRAFIGWSSKLGDPGHSSELRCSGAPVTRLRPEREIGCSRIGDNKSIRQVGRKQGRPELRPTMVRESEGLIRAEKLGNGWYPEPAEQRRPVLV